MRERVQILLSYKETNPRVASDTPSYSWERYWIARGRTYSASEERERERERSEFTKRKKNEDQRNRRERCRDEKEKRKEKREIEERDEMKRREGREEKKCSLLSLSFSSSFFLSSHLFSFSTAPALFMYSSAFTRMVSLYDWFFSYLTRKTGEKREKEKFEKRRERRERREEKRRE